MRGYMFKNRWGAVLFVAMVLAGVTRLVGTDKEQGALQNAADELAHQKAQAEQLTGTSAGQSTASETDMQAAFASDEELIDAAVGEDPTPIDESLPEGSGEGEEALPADQVIIVSRDAGSTQSVQVAPQAQPVPQVQP